MVDVVATREEVMFGAKTTTGSIGNQSNPLTTQKSTISLLCRLGEEDQFVIWKIFRVSPFIPYLH